MLSTYHALNIPYLIEAVMTKNIERPDRLAQTSIRFRAELLKKAKLACVEAGVSFQELIERALEAWLGLPAESTASTLGSTLETNLVKSPVQMLQTPPDTVYSVTELTHLNTKLDLIIEILQRAFNLGTGSRDRAGQDLTTEQIERLAEEARRLGPPVAKPGGSRDQVHRRPPKPLRRA